MNSAELIARAAAAPALLVATDFDGTLAEIVAVPDAAAAAPGALDALAALSRAGGVSVAVISGRSLPDLRARTAALGGVWRVGEHGAAIEDPSGILAREAEAPPPALDALAGEAAVVAGRVPGVRVERKPAALALHYREVALEDRGRALAAIAAWAASARRAGLCVLEGRSVVEARRAGHDKAGALGLILERTRAGDVVYAGDDTTDEPAIALARARGGVGVYVASPERPRAAVAADLVLDGPAAWIAVLSAVAARRRAPLRGATPQ